MSEPPGIFTQAASVLEDVEEFHFGYLPWLHQISRDDADTSKLLVTMTDPDEDEGDNETTKVYELSAAQIKQAFTTAKEKGCNLCCKSDIEAEQLGYGCAEDLDLILQTACFGEAVFG